MAEKTGRKEREFHLRRAEIMAEAERIFAAKGYYATTMAEIAEAAGFAIGSLYQFFDGKEHLYESVIAEKIEMMQSEIRNAALNGHNVKDKLEAIVKTHFSLVERYENFFAILIRWEGIYQADKSPTLLDRLLHNYRNYINFIESIIDEGREENRFLEESPRSLAIALLGMIDAYAFNWLINPERLPLGEQVKTILNLFFRGVGGYEET